MTMKKHHWLPSEVFFPAIKTAGMRLSESKFGINQPYTQIVEMFN